MGGRKEQLHRSQREQIAQTAARLIAEGVGVDYQAAKRKAARLLGLGGRVDWPSGEEIEEALIAYRQLFQPGQAGRLAELRRLALSAMRHFSRFRPQLVGSVLSGSAGEQAEIRLHLYAETPEEVLMVLLDDGIPFTEGSSCLRYRSGEEREFPSFSFVAEGVPVELVVMPPRQRGEAPAAAAEGGVMARADIRALAALLEKGEDSGG